MAKRFTDTEKWNRQWYRELGSKWRDIWNYLLDNCDHAGIWEIDLRTLHFFTGHRISLSDLSAKFGSKLVLIDADKLFIQPFIEFQYGELRDNNSVHVSITNRLQRLGIEHEVATGLSNKPSAVMKRLSMRKKKEVLAACFYKCSYCNIEGTDATLVVDHILSRAKGGGNEDHNLTSACVSCNSKKTDMDVEEFIQRHQLTASESLLSKIALIKSLNAPIKDSKSPKDKDKDKDNVLGDSNFDFESCYQAYPIKRGKDDGMQRLKKRIRDADTFNLFAASVRRYAHECRMERREAKYIKHWSTFVGTDDKEPWRDYAPSKTPPEPVLSPPPPPIANIDVIPDDPEERRRRMEHVRASMPVNIRRHSEGA